MFSVSTCPVKGHIETGAGVGSNTLFKPLTLQFINTFLIILPQCKTNIRNITYN